jgi:hypothetical protein
MRRTIARGSSRIPLWLPGLHLGLGRSVSGFPPCSGRCVPKCCHHFRMRSAVMARSFPPGRSVAAASACHSGSRISTPERTPARIISSVVQSPKTAAVQIGNSCRFERRLARHRRGFHPCVVLEVRYRQHGARSSTHCAAGRRSHGAGF